MVGQTDKNLWKYFTAGIVAVPAELRRINSLDDIQQPGRYWIIDGRDFEVVDAQEVGREGTTQMGLYGPRTAGVYTPRSGNGPFWIREHPSPDDTRIIFDVELNNGKDVYLVVPEGQ